MNIGINGLGRIGQLALRNIIERKDLNVVAINDLFPAEYLAFLLKYDSTHGKFNAEIKSNLNYLRINKDKISFSQFSNIQDINWKKYNVDYVFECTGKFNSKEKLIPH